MATLNGTMDWTLETDAGSTDYEVDYEVSPGEPATPRSYASGGEPACGPEVESVSVFYVPRRFDLKLGRVAPVRDGAGRKVRERRPELDDLVPDDAVIEYALERDSDLREDAAERRGEERLEARRLGL